MAIGEVVTFEPSIIIGFEILHNVPQGTLSSKAVLLSQDGFCGPSVIIGFVKIESLPTFFIGKHEVFIKILKLYARLL